MSRRARLFTDLLLVVQLIAGLTFGISRIIRMQESIEGVLITEFLIIFAFCVLNLNLAIRAYRAAPGRVIGQVASVYGVWALMLLFMTAAVVLRGDYEWGWNDNFSLLVAGLGSLGVLAVGRLRFSLSADDAIVRGYLAMFLKAWPQLALAYNISQNGGSGLPWLAVCIGHFTILIRISQLIFAIRKAGWDRNRKGSLISEVGNELSWVITTVVWLLN